MEMQLLQLSRKGLAKLAAVEQWHCDWSVNFENLHDKFSDIRRFMPLIQGGPYERQERKIPQRARILASIASEVRRAVAEIKFSPYLDHVLHEQEG